MSIPKKIIFNGPATILFWKDGTKTVARRRPNEPDDKLYGFLMAYFRKHCGMKNKDMKKWLKKKVSY